MPANEYKEFIGKHVQSDPALSDRTWSEIMDSYAQTKSLGKVKLISTDLHEAVRVAEKNSVQADLLNAEIFHAVARFLKNKKEWSLAHGCSLSDRVSQKFQYVLDDHSFCMENHVACAAAALESRHYPVALWQGNRAIHIADYAMDREIGPGKIIRDLRKEAVLAVIGVAHAAYNDTSKDFNQNAAFLARRVAMDSMPFNTNDYVLAEKAFLKEPPRPMKFRQCAPHRIITS